MRAPSQFNKRPLYHGNRISGVRKIVENVRKRRRIADSLSIQEFITSSSSSSIVESSDGDGDVDPRIDERAHLLHRQLMTMHPWPCDNMESSNVVATVRFFRAELEDWREQWNVDHGYTTAAVARWMILVVKQKRRQVSVEGLLEPKEVQMGVICRLIRTMTQKHEITAERLLRQYFRERSSMIKEENSHSGETILAHIHVLDALISHGIVTIPMLLKV